MVKIVQVTTLNIVVLVNAVPAASDEQVKYADMDNTEEQIRFELEQGMIAPCEGPDESTELSKLSFKL